MKPTEDLPPDVRPLYNRIRGITVYHSEFLPGEAKDEIRSALEEAVPDSWFTSPKSNASDGTNRPKSQVLADLRALCDIESAAQESGILGRSKLSWNLKVHSPLLDLALASHRHVDSELVNSVRITAPFVPPIGIGDHNGGALAESKMVDFALVLTPAPSWFRSNSRLESSGANKDNNEDDDLARALKRVVLSQLADVQSVNQTLYTPLRYRPIAVSIETKINGSIEEGKIQLGIWMSAWHRRISSLILTQSDLWADRLQSQGPVITLPLILVVENYWHLSFTCDRGDRLEVVEVGIIGDTSNLLGLYTIVAVLQELGGWVEGPFREWIKDIFQ